jgi:hypothetical protein
VGEQHVDERDTDDEEPRQAQLTEDEVEQDDHRNDHGGVDEVVGQRIVAKHPIQTGENELLPRP